MKVKSNKADSSATNANQPEDRHERAQEAAQIAFERPPKLKDWGFCSFGDAPGAIGGGSNVFLWFGNQSSMLGFIEQHLTWYNPGPANKDHDAVAAAVAATITQLRAGRLDLKSTIPVLNQSLRSFSQIEWVGTFSDLLNSSDEFARKIRGWFRGEEDSPSAQDPIKRPEVQEFRERLLEYCI